MIQVIPSRQLLLIICLFPLALFAQSDSDGGQKPIIAFSGFIDVFYAYDFNQPGGNTRHAFFYSQNRHNEFNLNLGYIKGSIDEKKYRASLAIQTGTYANDNYASEPALLKNIFEANAGISLSKKNTLWLDAGIFASHIGFESAVSILNWTLTRSILADNSPYYLSGAKLTYKPNKTWHAMALVCNGWQRIQKVQGNTMPSFGTQISYLPNDHSIINWSTFMGSDDPDSIRRMRYFNNLYAQFQLTGKLGMITGFDIGVQQKEKKGSTYNSWFSPVVIIRYAINDQWKTAFRAEYYKDKAGVIIPANTPNGFSTSGCSINLDYFPAANIACRMEARWLQSADKIFVSDHGMTRQNFLLIASIAVQY